MSDTIKVVNVISVDPDERNAGFVAPNQDISSGTKGGDEYGYFEVAEASPTGENPLSDWDNSVYGRVEPD